jgi:hypothetical protein
MITTARVENLTEIKNILRSGTSILSPTISSLQTKQAMVLGITDAM